MSCTDFSTHHYACDCREEEHERTRAALAKAIDLARHSRRLVLDESFETPIQRASFLARCEGVIGDPTGIAAHEERVKMQAAIDVLRYLLERDVIPVQLNGGGEHTDLLRQCFKCRAVDALAALDAKETLCP